MLPSDRYLTIAAPAEFGFKEKGSKFLAFAYPVADEAAVKAQLAQLRKPYFDATHHCYAYALGPQRAATRANDDGEPSGTAGLPILNQIKAAGLSDVLVVVVRYFGGTKLGAAGLVAAYKTAAAEVLALARPLEKTLTETLQLGFNYLALHQVMRVVKELDLPIVAQTFDNQCQLTVQVRASQAAAAKQKLTECGCALL
ncbi:MAG: YigZ family protein [Bernardetiaceae bacterium]|jgi:uncharacterized YigZ family protein|nr:YigZ family protein [Bernardetiaceae bacterium]